MLRDLWRVRVEGSVHAEYVAFSCAGLFLRSEALRINDEAFLRAAAENRRSILIDARRVVGRVPTILDRYEIGANVARSYLEQLPRIRLAPLADEPMIQPARCGDIVV